MGEILFRTRLSQSLFSGLAPWAALLPGRLLHVNVIGCTIFAAISGSSAATTQVVGRISLAELLKRGYSKDVAVGSLAGAGTLGFLIPPSNIMIIYGVLADVSIAKLFTAGFLPGFLLAGCFMGWMMSTPAQPGAGAGRRAKVRMASARRIPGLDQGTGPGGVPDPVGAGLDVWRLATPSEAAASGVLGALIVAAPAGRAELARLCGDALGAVQTCSHDRADRARRFDPGQRRGLSRHSARGRPIRHQLGSSRPSC